MKSQKYSTLKDIAKFAGTSVTSVSYILSGDPKRYVSTELRDRVLKAANELNYVKSALATGLKGQNGKMIAMLVPQFDNIFFTRLTTGVEGITYKHGYILNICNSFDNSKRERAVIENLIMHRIDGILISPTESSDDNIRYIKDFGVPFVVFDRSLNEMAENDAVLTDNFNSGYMAAKKLLDAGHRHIVFLEWKTMIPNLKDRFYGCVKAFEERNIPRENILLFSYKEMNNTKGSIIAEQIINSRDITAIIFGYHILAENFFKYLTQNNNPFFERMSIVVIGTPVWTNFCNPPITCIDLREHEIGRSAAKRLIEKIESESDGNILSPMVKIVGCKFKEEYSVEDS